MATPPTLNDADMSPIKSTNPLPVAEMTSPGGGTPSISQKRSMAKRSRESESPDVKSRKRAKHEGACTPSTQPREPNEPSRPHKDKSVNGSFINFTEASQLDFSHVGSQPSEHGGLEDSQPGVALASQEGAVIISEDIDLDPSPPTVHLETLGELDEDMTTPENVCSTGSEPSPVPEHTEEEMCEKDKPPAATPDCSQVSIIIDERSKDSVLETPAHGASLDTTRDEARDVTVKAVNFAPDNAEMVEAAATSAACAAASATAPAPAPAPKSSYCNVM